MGTDTACDTCILINFALVDRIDLLTTLAEFRFCIPEDVWAEIERPDLRQVIEQFFRSGQLQLVRLDVPEELALFAIYNQVLGKGKASRRIRRHPAGFTGCRPTGPSRRPPPSTRNAILPSRSRFGMKVFAFNAAYVPSSVPMPSSA